jgi:hypothetical protein
MIAISTVASATSRRTERRGMARSVRSVLATGRDLRCRQALIRAGAASAVTTTAATSTMSVPLARGVRARPAATPTTRPGPAATPVRPSTRSTTWPMLPPRARISEISAS